MKRRRIPNFLSHAPQMSRNVLRIALLIGSASAASAQVSLTSAVDLALRTSPRVKAAEADVLKARAALAETKDVFIPSISAGAGIGQSYGYSPNPPTLFYATGQSIVYTAGQFSYIHAARAGFNAARRSFEDVRESVAEDVALTYIALVHDQQREHALEQQFDDTEKLTSIISDRVDAGRDPHLDLTVARVNAANLRVSRLRAQDETANDRRRLAELIGRPADQLQVQSDFPTAPLPPGVLESRPGPANAAVAAAFQNARAKQQQAIGDSKYLYRPSISLFVQYNRYATFTESFQQIQVVDASGNKVAPGPDQAAFGFQFNIPLFDRTRRDKNRESVADASRALHEAESAQQTALDGQSKLRHTLEELGAQAEAANLSQQLAQEQLEIVQLQMQAPAAGAPATTPKEEQNARIAERERYLTVVDTSFQLRQAQVSLLRQTGRLLEWLTTSGLIVPPPPPHPTLKHP